MLYLINILNFKYSGFCIRVPSQWWSVKIILHRIISKVWLPSSLSVTRNNSSHDDEAECVPLSGKRFWTNLVQGIEDRSGPPVHLVPGGGTHRLSGWTGSPLDLFTRTIWSTPPGENNNQMTALLNQTRQLMCAVFQDWSPLLLCPSMNNQKPVS